MQLENILLILTLVFNIIILTVLIFRIVKGEKREKREKYENIFSNGNDALNFAYSDYYKERQADRNLANI